MDLRSQILLSVKDATEAGLRSAQSNIKGLAQEVTAANRVLQGFLAASAANQVVDFGRTIVQSRIEVDRFRSTMTASVGAQNVATEMSYVRREAERLGIPLQTSAQEYAKLAIAAQGTKLAGAGVRDIFAAITGASATLNVSAADTEGMLRAVTQMMSKGKVQAEELRGQLGDRLPGAFQAAARAMGVSTAEFDQMLEKGQVIAEDFLPKFAAELNRTFGVTQTTVMKTAQAEVNRLSNAWTELKQATAEGPIGKAAMNVVSGMTVQLQQLTEATKQSERANLSWWQSFSQMMETAATEAPWLRGIPGFEQFGTFSSGARSARDQIAERASLDAARARNADRQRENFTAELGGFGDREGARGARLTAEAAARRAAQPAWQKLLQSNDEQEKIKALKKEITEAGIAAGKTDAEIAKLIATATAKKGKGEKSDWEKEVDSMVRAADSAGEAVAKLQAKVDGFHNGPTGQMEAELRALQDKRSGLGMLGATDKDTQRALAALDAQIEAKRQQIELEKQHNEQLERRKAYETAIEQLKANEDAAQRSAGNVGKELQELRDANNQRGMAKSQIEEITIARLEERLALESGVEGNAAIAKALAEEIRLRQQLKGELSVKEHFDEQDASARKELERTKSAAEEFGLVMKSATEEAILKWESLGDVIKAVGMDLARIGVRKLITEPLFNEGGAIAGWLGSLFGGGMVVGGADAGLQMSAEAAAIPAAMRRANGGPVRRGGIYEVVERGTPELVQYGNKSYLMSPGEGQVTPIGGGGGGGINVSIVQHNSVDARSDMTSIRTMMIQAQQNAIAAVRESMRSNGWARQGV